jgi:outer membrane immunogenic protein
MLAGTNNDAADGRQGQIKMLNLIRYLIRRTVRYGLVLGLSLLSVVTALAQGAPVAELGADYNYVRANAPPDGCGCFSMHGANAWFAYNFTHSFGVVAEVSSQRASDIGGSGQDLTLTSYLFGPRYSWHKSGHFAPFAQVLLGGAHASGSFASDSSGFAGSSNAFAVIAGGGLDIGITRHFAVRALEADYYRTQFTNGLNDRQNNLRLSAGVIFRFGEK